MLCRAKSRMVCGVQPHSNRGRYIYGIARGKGVRKIGLEERNSARRQCERLKIVNEHKVHAEGEEG